MVMGLYGREERDPLPPSQKSRKYRTKMTTTRKTKRRGNIRPYRSTVGMKMIHLNQEREMPLSRAH